MRRNILNCAISVFLAVLLFAPPAHANMIMPIWFMGWMAMFMALIPIIVIEAIVLWFKASTGIWESGLAATLGNVASTVIGIPVAVTFHALLRIYFDETPDQVETAWQKTRMMVWHVQYDMSEGNSIPIWVVFGGCLILMFPCFVASWLSEAWVARLLLSDYPTQALDQAVFAANLMTYGVLVILLSGYAAWFKLTFSLDSNLRPDSDVDLELVDGPRLANESDKRGMARLTMTENKIERPMLIRTSGDVHRIEDVRTDTAA